jgi:anti-anti-sigma factor
VRLASAEPNPAFGEARLVYALDGELDLAAAEVFRSRVEQLAPAPGGGAVVLDLSRLTFIDCAGVGALCQLHKALRAAGGPGLMVKDVQPQVRKVFEPARSERVLDRPRLAAGRSEPVGGVLKSVPSRTDGAGDGAGCTTVSENLMQSRFWNHEPSGS